IMRLAFTATGRRLVTGSGHDLRVWDVVGGRELLRRENRQRVHDQYHAMMFASSLDVAPDGRSFATGHSDGNVLVWEMPPGPPRKPLGDDERARRWADLAGADARQALAGGWALADRPGEAAPFLRERLKPAVPPDPRRLEKLIADLDSPAFAAREAAAKELAELGELAEDALGDTLEKRPSAEVRRRIEQLL